MDEYTLSYDIELPLLVSPETAARAWTDPAAPPDWQAGFVSREQREGEPFAQDSRANLTFAFGSRPMTMAEHVLAADLPDLLRVEYRSGGYRNVAEDRFEPAPDGTTLWRAHHEWDLADLELAEPPSEEDRLRFQTTTAATMEAFKRYVEALGA